MESTECQKLDTFPAGQTINFTLYTILEMSMVAKILPEIITLFRYLGDFWNNFSCLILFLF